MIKPLTSLRFVFALMVFSSHLINFLKGNEIYNSYFLEGKFGVSFFFILSGFILSFNYKNKFLEKKDFKKFYISRIARIYPVHILTLIIALPLSLGGFFLKPFVWFIKFLLNLLLLHSFIPIKNFYFSFNGPSWSISDEMFFYLLFPFFILMFNKIKLSKFYSFVFILLISLSIQFFPDTIVNGYFYVNPFFRITDFIIGILIFYIYDSKKVEAYIKYKNTFTFIEIGSIILFFIFFTFHKYIPFGYRLFGYYWIPMSLLILIFSYQSGYISKLLSGKMMIVLGEISFSFYLIHQLIIKFIYALNKKMHWTENGILLILVVFFISLILSYLMYNFIELPSNRYLKNKLIKKD